MFVNERPVRDAPPVLALYNLCAGTDWAVLPVAGGLYDQHPEFIDGLQVIFKAQSEKAAKERRESERSKRKAGRR